MDFLFERFTYIFDPLHHFWEHERMHRRFALGLIVVFLSALAGIELNRHGLLPASIAAHTPTNHFYAVNLAFTLVLILEVISLIFTLPCSFSKSVGKQFEILSLILLRDAFKELSYFPEPITLGSELTPVYHILGYGFGALAIFALLGVYYRVQPVKKQDMGMPHDLFRFVAAKKGIALIILGTFVILGANNLYNMFAGLTHIDFFLSSTPCSSSPTYWWCSSPNASGRPSMPCSATQGTPCPRSSSGWPWPPRPCTMWRSALSRPSSPSP